VHVDFDGGIAAGVEDLTGDDLGDGCGGHVIWKTDEFCRGGERFAQPCNAGGWVKIWLWRFF
jgi:hypothetical protein